MHTSLKGILSVLCVCVVNVWLLGCAKPGYPPGGPEDKSGPLVRASYPTPGNVNLPVDVRPWIELNEYPLRSSVPGAIFISPTLEGEFETRVKDKRLEVRFPTPLPANRTIVITFGTSLKDLVGNPMSEPFVLAFSTGDSLDTAVIEGDISGVDKPASTWVWAYPLDSLKNLDPSKTKAPFAAQPDDRGHFRLTYLPVQHYRVFAVSDDRADRLWQSQTESIAIPSREVQASADSAPQLKLKLDKLDLTPPHLIGVEALHRQGLRLSLDEPVIVTGARVKVQTESGQSLSIIGTYQNPADSAAILLTTAIQREGDVYMVRLDSVSDRYNNLGDSLVAEVAASMQVDTIGPKLSWTYPASGSEAFDPHADIQVGFSEAIILTDVPRAVHLSDSTGAEVKGTWKYSHPALVEFTPDQPLTGGRRYGLAVWGDSLRDIIGVVSPDSFASVHFRIVDATTLGSISGQVIGAEPNLRLAAEQLDQTTEIWETTVNGDGRYYLENLPAAVYRLSLYQDDDGNQRWSPGLVEPFHFSEPFKVVRDSLRVRASWETESVELEWKP
jgi:hypothetical protein